MEKYILISAVGKTDPIRGEYDGPILHILRHYKPEKAVFIFSKEVGESERNHGYMARAAEFVLPSCEIDCRYTALEDPHSFDSISELFLLIFGEVKGSFPDYHVLLNITSGTPQMETALCMIALAEPERCTAVQVFTPEKKSNEEKMFHPGSDDLEDWLEMNLDNEADSPSRCHVPMLMNFRRPMIQFQIQSLIQNYDYAGAFQLYQNAKDHFSSRVGELLQHARYRLNLEFEKAEKCRLSAKDKQDLYPALKRTESRLLEYCNSMAVKQARGELHDLVLRTEVFTCEFAFYFLEKRFGIHEEDIIVYRDNKRYLDHNKAEKVLPGIAEYMDRGYPDGYRWNSFVTSQNIIKVLTYAAETVGTDSDKCLAEEVKGWSVGFVRNRAAHTMTAITEDMIRKAYEKGDSKYLIEKMKQVMVLVSGGRISKDHFLLYDRINEKIRDALSEIDNV